MRKSAVGAKKNAQVETRVLICALGEHGIFRGETRPDSGASQHPFLPELNTSWNDSVPLTFRLSTRRILMLCRNPRLLASCGPLRGAIQLSLTT